MFLETTVADRIAAASARIGKNLTTEDRIARVREELHEVEAEVAKGDFAKAESEMGDLLLSVVLLCQGFDFKTGPMQTYTTSASKIFCRLEHIEARMAEGASRADAIKEAKSLYP